MAVSSTVIPAASGNFICLSADGLIAVNRVSNESASEPSKTTAESSSTT